LVIRSVHLTDGINQWINDFRDSMRREHSQEVSYTSLLNLLARFGVMVLMKPETLTLEQKEFIKECINEANEYKLIYPKITWVHEYERFFVPKLLDGNGKKPWEK